MIKMLKEIVFRLASLEENRLGFTDKLKSLYEKNK